MIQIYKASAGSGKTFTLAREYIKLILGVKTDHNTYRLRRPGSHSQHSSVLAITFTNKATDEMKSRIIHELAVLAGAEKGWTQPSSYASYLCKELHCTPADLSQAAAEALKSLLFDFNNFNVSTIDSFFQMVLRSFAHEAEVSGAYDVELDDKSVIAMSIDNLLQDLNHKRQDKDSRKITEWLTRFMTKLIEDGLGFNIFNRSSQVHENLISFIADISDDTFRDNEKLILDYLRDGSKFDTFRSHVESRIRKLKADTAAACQNAVTAMKSVNPVGPAKGIVTNNVSGPIVNWAASGYYTGSQNRAELSATMLKAIDNVDEAYVKDGKKSSHRSVLDPALSAALTAINKCIGEIELLRLISGNIYQLGLLARVSDYLDRYRMENSAILLSDTNALLSKVIGDSDSPFLYEKMGTRYKHYLIDEFQDTSFSQWNNLSHLVEESIAGGHDNLVIGDEKQCIYRFRGSDPTLLHNLHTGRADDEFVIKGESIAENTNWRSSAAVVEFNNTLFKEIARTQNFDDIYAGVEQQVAQKEIQGYVRVELLEGERGSTEADDKALETLAENLRRQLQSGYRPGDIAVLVRTWREGETVISYLENIKVSDTTFPAFNIVSDRSLLVSHSPAVMLIISRLRYLSSIEYTPKGHKRSHREIARVLNDFEETFACTHSTTGSLLTAIERMETRRNTRDGEEQEKKETPEPEDNIALDLTSLVESITTTFVPEENRCREAIFITAFQDLVADFVAKGRSDIRSFLEWWDEKGVETSVSGSGDDPSALNILTIHKSKGLEFPCVHIPFAGLTENTQIVDRAWFEIPEMQGFPDDIVPPMMPLDITKAMMSTPLSDQYLEIQRRKQLDLINLLYVAFTRAVNELIVSVKVMKESTNSKSKPITPSLAKVISSSLRATMLPDGNLLEIGTPTHRSADKKKAKSAIVPDEGERVSVYDTSATPSPWSKTRLDGKNRGNLYVARERGIILHDLMACVQTPDDIDTAFRMAQASESWADVTEAETQELKKIVESRVNDEKAAPWFKGFNRALREREVLTDKGEIKRFDRVVWTADGQIHLIDYKTGSQPPRRYRKQLQGYLNFFKSIGYPGVRAFLYYLDSGEIIEIES
ncbi:MAG: UvrD-helicase domain-containing protein [Muribaculaceae bacterium]|nr:UvrD-helicase domain-containing protein [Muribaculaceae bacterium]